MPLNKRQLQQIITRNGHLRLEGDETAEELRAAVIRLRTHTYARCHKPLLGQPIEGLIPDVSVVYTSRTILEAQDVDTGGRL